MKENHDWVFLFESKVVTYFIVRRLILSRKGTRVASRKDRTEYSE